MHPVLFHIGAVLIPSYGALGAAGVLLALFLTHRTARTAGVAATEVWNLSVAAVFAAIVAGRLLLVAVNWSAVGRHPAWALDLAMIHHPLVAGVGVAAGLAVAATYALWRKMPLRSTADALAAPLALGLALEQFGALLVGSGYGIDAGPKLPWAVTYTSALAQRWSGTPLGVPLHPAQAYAALAFLALAVFLFFWLQVEQQKGDVAGLCLMGLGVAIFFTEIWRDPEGRGLTLGGALDGPQIAAVAMVFAGAWVLRERKAAAVKGAQ